MLSQSRPFFLAVLSLVAVSIAISSCTNIAFGENRLSSIAELGLRIVWGGNEPHSYYGEILHEASPLKVNNELSLDHSGTIRKSEQANRILVRDPKTRFGGCDLMITGKLDSVVKLRFKPELTNTEVSADTSESLEMQFTLEQILAGPRELVLGSKARVVVDRIPGDMLRVSNVRPNWVFAPSESIPIQVIPNCTGARNQSATLDWELIAHGESDSLDRGSVPVTLNELGSSTSVSLGGISAPERLGVYEIRLTLRPRRSFTQVFPANIAERRIEFVVASTERFVDETSIESNRRSSPSIDWSHWSIGKDSLSNRSLPISLRPWGRVTSNLKRLSLSKDDDAPRTIPIEPRETLTLPIENLQPHQAYKISFASESTMDGMEIRIYEALETGEKVDLRLISNSKVQPTLQRLLGKTSDLATAHYAYRFTTSSTRAVVSITSLRAHGSMTLSEVRVEPTGYEKLELVNSRKTVPRDAPKIIEYISAEQWRELLTKSRAQHGKGRYDTWATIVHATEAWLAMCKTRGANCVAIPVLSSGSTLYPSERLLTNPALNTGVFDPSARDPISKDIVHWLYILCDKYSLEFVPVFEWNHSLHSFKNLQVKDDMWGTLEIEPPTGARRWNPFHSEVQVEMKLVLKEFEKRYSQVKGYRGYAVHLGKTSPLTLADSISQISDAIVNELLTEQIGRISNDMEDRRIALEQLSGNAIHLKHQQLVLSSMNDWECELSYVFTDTPQSFVDLSQSGPSLVYIHPFAYNVEAWVARRRWIDGFRPITYQTNVTDAQLHFDNTLPSDIDWLTSSIPIEGQALQQRVDRIRAWRSQDSTRVAILNANPWDRTVNLQWSVIPQNLRAETDNCRLEEIKQSPAARNITIPANQMVFLRWDNPNASPHTWGTDESQALNEYQSALQHVESAINLFSIPTIRSDLIDNAGFDNAVTRPQGELIPGWGISLNPKAPVSLQSDSPHSGPNHLRVACDQAGAASWLQSSPFPLQSNRLQVSMHYRVQPGETMNLQWTLSIWNENSSRFDTISQRSASVDFSKRTDQWGMWTEDFSEELASLGVSQCHIFRLQLDVQGDCTMDFDSLSLATDYLLERERIDLRNTLFLARRSLTEGSSEALYRLLDSNLVRTLLLWAKDSDLSHQAEIPSVSRNVSGDDPRAKTPAEAEKRSSDRRWRFWSR